METIILKEELLPDMRNISKYFIFQHDSVPANRAKETVDLLSTETPAFISPTLLKSKRKSQALYRMAT